MEASTQPPRRGTPSLSTLVLIAFGLGIAAGLFFGEGVAFLAPIGSAYVGLLQMTVLPYIVLSIVPGLGRLRPSTARRLARVSILTILLIWTVGVGASLLMPLSYPNWVSASFFSRALVERPPPFDLLGLYIPRNIFGSLANAAVPAVVVFCILLGVSLMGVEKKDALLETLGSLADAVMRLTSLVVRTAPLGIFALAAAAAGTLHVEQFQALQVYVWGYAAMWVVLVFWALPVLIGAVTGIEYGRVFGATKDALVTGFATGSLLVVLPLLSEAIKRLLAERGVESENATAMVDIVVPTAYNFPAVGMLLTMSFVHFGAWLVGAPLELSKYPTFAVLSVVTAFGGWTIAIPFLLDAFRLPADIFELYPLVDVITGRLSVVAAAVQLVAVTLIVVGSLVGLSRPRWRSMLRFAGGTAAFALVAVLGSKAVMSRAISQEYVGYKALVERVPLLESTPVRHAEGAPNPLAGDARSADRLGLIRERGWLRVGYVADALPFAFRNEDGQVVGFDAEMARDLATDLEVGVEFARLGTEDLVGALERGSIDIVMTGLVIEPGRAQVVAYSIPYLDLTASLVVPDHARHEFSSLDRLLQRKRLRIGVVPAVHYRRGLQRYLPNAEIVPAKSPRPFFQGELEVDAILMGAEEAAAWTLVYPRYSVVVPFPDEWGAPMAYPLSTQPSRLHGFVNAWLQLAARDGTVDRYFSYWILGEELPSRREPRWSIIRDVLSWVD